MMLKFFNIAERRLMAFTNSTVDSCSKLTDVRNCNK